MIAEVMLANDSREWRVAAVEVLPACKRTALWMAAAVAPWRRQLLHGCGSCSIAAAVAPWRRRRSFWLAAAQLCEWQQGVVRKMVAEMSDGGGHTSKK